jgi:hypothetical protein
MLLPGCCGRARILPSPLNVRDPSSPRFAPIPRRDPRRCRPWPWYGRARLRSTLCGGRPRGGVPAPGLPVVPGADDVVARISGVKPAIAVAVAPGGGVYLRRGAAIPALLTKARYCANPRRGNYFALIEQAAAEALADAGYTGGALSLKLLLSVVSQHGFSVKYVHDLPRSARSVTDLRNRRIYPQARRWACTRRGRSCKAQRRQHLVIMEQAPCVDFERA